MTESNRTIAYVVVAALSIVVAVFATPKVDITPQELANAKLNQPFFPDFTNPNEATSIRVVAFDEARALSRPFAVEYTKDPNTGKEVWTIPSHHNYPADGAQKLAKTATSVIGIKREEFRSSSKEDHEALGVIDPLDPDTARLKGRGQRLTLSKGESPLVDLIIGKPVSGRSDDSGASGGGGKFYYVRVPTEDSTYVAKLDIDLSTKFADWVETDLLKLNRDQLTELTVDKYSIVVDQQRPAIVPGEIVRLSRAKSGEPWKLEGLDDQMEELETSKVNDAINTLDDMKIAGIRPKPKGLNPDLTIDRKYVDNQLDLQVLVGDMRSRGFEIGPDRDDPKQPRLYSRQGEFSAANNDGVVYVLRFGEIFAGDEEEIEVGGTKDKAAAKPDDSADKTGEDGDKQEASEGAKGSSRYLFVTAHLDEQYLGPRPVEPQRPAGLSEEDEPAQADSSTKPAIRPGKKPARGGAEPDASDEAATPQETNDCGPPAAQEGQDDAADDATENDSPADEPGAETPADDADSAPAAGENSEADPASTDKPDDAPAADAAKSQEDLKKEYQTLKQKYDADLKAYEDKLEAGRKRVDELNQRFGEWYYVISADSFSKLHLSRKDLVKEKKPADDKKTGGDNPAGSSPGGTSSDKAADSQDLPTDDEAAADDTTKDDATGNDAAGKDDTPPSEADAEGAPASEAADEADVKDASEPTEEEQDP